MLSYSPYDNVTAQAYPPMLVSAGLNDPRVTYWEPAKWVARLRAARTNDAALLLRTNMGAGHAGKSGRWGALREDAEEDAVVLTQLGGEKKGLRNFQGKPRRREEENGREAGRERVWKEG